MERSKRSPRPLGSPRSWPRRPDVTHQAARALWIAREIEDAARTLRIALETHIIEPAGKRAWVMTGQPQHDNWAAAAAGSHAAAENAAHPAPATVRSGRSNWGWGAGRDFDELRAALERGGRDPLSDLALRTLDGEDQVLLMLDPIARHLLMQRPGVKGCASSPGDRESPGRHNRLLRQKRARR